MTPRYQPISCVRLPHFTRGALLKGACSLVLYIAQADWAVTELVVQIFKKNIYTSLEATRRDIKPSTVYDCSPLWHCEAPWTLALRSGLHIRIYRGRIMRTPKVISSSGKILWWPGSLYFEGTRLPFTLTTVRITAVAFFAAANCFLVSILNVWRSEITSPFAVVLRDVKYLFSLITSFTWRALFL